MKLWKQTKNCKNIFEGYKNLGDAFFSETDGNRIGLGIEICKALLFYCGTCTA